VTECCEIRPIHGQQRHVSRLVLGINAAMFLAELVDIGLGIAALFVASAVDVIRAARRPAFAAHSN